MNRSILKGGAIGIGVRAGAILLEFLIAIALAKSLGVAGYGTYALFFAVVKIASLPASAGLPTLTVREVAVYAAENRWGLMRGFLIRMNQAVMLVSLLVFLLYLTWSLGFQDGLDEGLLVWCTLAMVPLLALGNLKGATLRGLRLVGRGLAPEHIIRPSLFLFALGVFAVFWGELTPGVAMALHAMGAAIAFGVGAGLLRRALPTDVAHAKPEFRDSTWMRAALPFSMISGIQIVNAQAGVVVLGFLGGVDEAGLFRAAMQVSLVATFPITALSLALSPHFAHLYAKGRIVELQRLMRLSSWLTLGVAVATALLLVLSGDLLLVWVFGSGFEAGYGAMLILLLGQCVNASTGALYPLLKMVGRERVFAWAAAVGAVLNVMVAVLLVSLLGSVGAAIGASLSLVFVNLALAVYSIKSIGISPFPIGGARA